MVSKRPAGSDGRRSMSGTSSVVVNIPLHFDLWAWSPEITKTEPKPFYNPVQWNTKTARDSAREKEERKKNEMKND